MQYHRFGIDMHRLNKQHIEEVRQWRNLAFIKNAMQFQDEIGPEDQKRWYNKLDPVKNWYFVAHFEKKPVGLFHVKNIDWNSKYGESGGFVNEQKSIGSFTIGLAILALMDFAFLVIDLEGLCVTYNPNIDNISSLNRQLGYEIFDKAPNGFVKAKIKKEQFYAKSNSFYRAALKLRGNECTIINPDTFVEKKLKEKCLKKRFERSEF